MVERLQHCKLTWVNLKNPSAAEVQAVMEEFGFPPSLMADLTTTVPKSTVTCQGGVVKITMDFPVVKRIDIAHPYEVKFLISPKCFLSVQYEEMEAFDRFKKEFEVIATLNKTSKSVSAPHLFIGLMTELYVSASNKLDYIESRLADIETEIFSENEKQMVFEISSVSKRLITFRHILRTHDDLFRDIRPLFEHIYKKQSYGKELEEIHTTYFVLQRRSSSLYETLSALRETNFAMLTTKQNEIMKMLTIMAFITFPLTLFTSMFGMNTTTTPILGREGDFWIIVGSMTVLTASFFAFFKYKKWI